MAKSKIVGILNLDKAMKEILDEYGDEVYEVLGKAVDEVSDEAVKKLQAGGSFGGTGAYKKDWVADDIPTGRLSKAKVIHNEDHYRLAHLLEKGHVIRNGTGRTYGTVQAFPHIKPVEEWAKDELPRKVKEMIEGV